MANEPSAASMPRPQRIETKNRKYKTTQILKSKLQKHTKQPNYAHMYVKASEPSPTSFDNEEQIQKFLKPSYSLLTLIILPSDCQIQITEVQKCKKENI